MAEQQPAEGPGEKVPAPVPAPRAEGIPKLFTGRGGDEQDDTPTIISRTIPHSARPDEAFAGSLRGRTLAHFELLEPIGVGGMAAVIRARDVQLDRYVALKILPPEMAGDPENVQRFHQEARAAARLDHENIARVFFCGEDQRLHLIAFEFVEGDNLRVILERRGRLPVSEAVQYMLQIAAGLAHAAVRGVVHRDIKPSNIIISPNGRAKLVDMGLARSREPHLDNGLTHSGVTLGTFDYISPEQALEPRDADVRSDLYSLGCTFFHMLTGQPPVPEGTAAKKLHHHQHVPPIDPRQLNPSIPDDVAAILGCMMAKDPKDRYQRPEHLVQHLLQVAQRLGIGNDGPDAMLFVDAPLPSPPRQRPALIAALALLSLGALIALLSLAPTRSSSRWHDLDQSKVVLPKAEKDPPLRTDSGPPKTQDLVEPRGQFRVREDIDLVRAFASPEAIKEIILENDVRLNVGENASGGPASPLLFRGKTLLLRSEKRNSPRSLTITFASSAEEAQVTRGLVFAGEDVTLQDLRITIQKTSAAAERFPSGPRAALDLTNGSLRLLRCAFVQDYPADGLATMPDPDIQLAALAIHRAGSGAAPRLFLEDCYFERGQCAVAISGPASVKVANCAFGPHLALFQLRGTCARTDTILSLTNCAAFLVNGPAFRLDNRAGATLIVQHSIFGTGTGSAGGPEADLIFQTDTTEATVCYQGRHNVYHNLNSFWVLRAAPDTENPEQINRLSEFRTKARAQGGMEEESWVPGVGISPWKNATPLANGDFHLKTNLPELRVGEKADQMIGVRTLLGEGLYPRELPPVKPPPVGPLARKTIKIVDPNQETGKGIYESLTGAIAEARSGDEIQIKFNGAVKINRLEKPLENLTIKPFEGYRPILVLNETPEKKAALFRLHDGQIRFENFEFQLQPNKTEYEYQTVVEIIGSGRCTFDHCTFTLVESDKTPVEKRPSVVRLTDPGDAMKTGEAAEPKAPEIVFQDCLVRGQGDLAAVFPSRPLVLDLQNTALALDGSLMNVDSGTRDLPAASFEMKSPVQLVKLDHVLAYLTEPVLLLRARGGKGIVPLKVERAADSLFMAAAARPLVQLDGLDSELQVGQLFSWNNGNNNVYLNFEKMLDSPRSSYDQGIWENGHSKGVSDKEPHFGTGKLNPKKPLSRLAPEDFKEIKADDREMELSKYGPDLDKLPRPGETKKPDPERTPDQDP